MHNLPILGTNQVSEMFAIPVRRLTAFAELQIVDHHDQRPGTGNTRRYSIANLMMTKLASNLQQLGVAPKKLSRKSELLNHGIVRFLIERVHYIFVQHLQIHQYGGRVSEGGAGVPRYFYFRI